MKVRREGLGGAKEQGMDMLEWLKEDKDTDCGRMERKIFVLT